MGRNESTPTDTGSEESSLPRREHETEEQYQRRLQEHRQLRSRVDRIKHKILILSGKGGVGKSTVAVNLALALVKPGKRVGLLDIDIHGPSIPKLLNLEGNPLMPTQNKTLLPVEHESGLKVISIGFLLPDQDVAVIWRGPRKYHAIRQFLSDVEWGDLDYLIIDSPPGTGDEPLSIVELIGNADGAIVVTTPQEVAISDVRKCVTFCRQLNLPVLGVLENMSGFICPYCKKRVDIFKTGGGEAMAREMKIRFLGRIPLDPQIVESGDAGTPHVHTFAQSQTAQAFKEAITPILKLDEGSTISSAKKEETHKPNETATIAVPVAGGVVSMHFGHCDEFVLFGVNEDTKQIIRTEVLSSPPHEPGILPKWLHEKGANLIITGGMGSRAQQLFAQHGVKVVTGVKSEEPETAVQAYLAGDLQTGENICDH